MLTLDVLDDVELTGRPAGQMILGWIIRANYRFPPTRTRIDIEGLDRLPSEGHVYLAMNHTDRFNYWPFQVELWRKRDEFTATWVKGKYFNNELLGRFMVSMNNIPAPSKGYLITADSLSVLGEPPSNDLYRVIREAWDESHEFDEARSAAEDAGVVRELDRLNETPRDMLGRTYDPSTENFLEALNNLFGTMMGRFVELNEEAFGLGLKIVVFPEGTRSRRLGTGRPGLAQMAIRTGATIVPIGCNHSDVAYPGDNPFSRGGDILYRVGEPLTPESELAPFQIDEPYQPFTSEADAYSDVFADVTDLVMERIDGLLDPRHRARDDVETEVTGTRRFV